MQKTGFFITKKFQSYPYPREVLTKFAQMCYSLFTNKYIKILIIRHATTF